MPPLTRTLFAAFLSITPLAGHTAGYSFLGPSDPTPRPANPGNNPWLNYPTHYGKGAATHNFAGNTSPDRLENLNRFMKLSEAERMQIMRQGESDAMTRGRALFNDPKLGNSGLTCAACHPDGGTAGGRIGMGEHEIAIPSLIGVANRYPRFKPLNGRVITQTEMQNNCLVMFLQGEPLGSGTHEAADLTYYVGAFRSQP